MKFHFDICHTIRACHVHILHKIFNAPSNILLTNISKSEVTESLQILYMLKITIFKQNSESVLQLVLSVKNDRMFGNRKVLNKNNIIYYPVKVQNYGLYNHFIEFE